MNQQLGIPINLSVRMIQFNPKVGAIESNCESIIRHIYEDRGKSDLIIFPELAICGYPPEDLLLRDDFLQSIDAALNKIISSIGDTWVIVGYPKRIDGLLYNCAGVIHRGELVTQYQKQALPNYQVFDEKRYFFEGSECSVVNIKDYQIGLLICEDIWVEEPIQKLANEKVDLVISINASPFSMDSYQQRIEIIKKRIQQTQLPLLYVNQTGGQDELVFDGTSMLWNKQAHLLFQTKAFASESVSLNLAYFDSFPRFNQYPNSDCALYEALVLGLKDYCYKNKFDQVLLGLSGGIDSALTLAIAVDALGHDRVSAFMLPYIYTSDISKNDAVEQAEGLKVAYHSIEIESAVESIRGTLKKTLKNNFKDITEQNIQSRTRGVLLMALSNNNNQLLLTTGNKSEMAVGYATLYGDMCGGYNPLKDVLKTKVYQLANYRNSLSEVIPQRVIDREPSAELAHNQEDRASLPDYDTLDAIIKYFVEDDLNYKDIVAKGIDEKTVKSVIKLISRSEHKRYQSTVGLRVTERGFGRDRRYPLTNGWF